MTMLMYRLELEKWPTGFSRVCAPTVLGTWQIIRPRPCAAFSLDEIVTLLEIYKCHNFCRLITQFYSSVQFVIESKYWYCSPARSDSTINIFSKNVGGRGRGRRRIVSYAIALVRLWIWTSRTDKYTHTHTNELKRWNAHNWRRT